MVNDIAIIGMAGKFPGAKNVDEFYQNLLAGKDSVDEISKDRLLKTTLPESKDYMICGYLDDIDVFDHQLFNISLGEAKTMDPHQRIMLEIVYETFEDAGYTVDDFNGSNTSVFLADANLEYYKHADEFVPTLASGNTKAFLASRVNQQFGLKGSAIMIDTTCSSSLVALHMACNELKLGDAETALVGGVHLVLFPFKEEINGIVDLNAPDGKSKAFSSEANGMSVGEAAACILIKPLAKAMEDNDNIHAIIKSSAINSNANLAASLTAPDSKSQADVIEKAWKKANIDPLKIGYIETHGSGTSLGDSIEIGGLNEAFRNYNSSTKFCPISTVKSNVGHTRTMAGLTGLIKVVLSLQNKVLFPTIHFNKPHPLIDFENSAVYVNRSKSVWERKNNQPLLAGLSSIGLSGTNSHVVLEEFSLQRKKIKNPINTNEKRNVFFFSANSKMGLEETLKKYLRFLEVNPRINLNDLAFTLAIGRKHHQFRYVCSANNRIELIGKIKNSLSSVSSIPTTDDNLQMLFVASPQTYVNNEIIDILSDQYPSFKLAYQQCLKAVHRPNKLQKIFIFQYAYFNLLKSLGLNPDTVIGIGIGKELTGVISKKKKLNEVLELLGQSSNEDLTSLKIDKINKLLKESTVKGKVIFVELGYSSDFSEIVKQNEEFENRVFINHLTPKCEKKAIQSLTRKLFELGVALNSKLINNTVSGKRISLPATTLNRQRCWLRETPKSEKPNPGILQEPIGERINWEGQKSRTAYISSHVAKFWCQHLEIESFKKEDNFFELGGNSITATKVINNINTHFYLNLDFEDVFDFQEFILLINHIEECWKIPMAIKTIWSDVLKIEKVDGKNDFFELGGHSLIANQVMMQYEKVFEVKIDFDEFFKNPSLEEQVALIQEMSKKSSDVNPVLNIPMMEEQFHYPVSNGQLRLWTIGQNYDGLMAYNQAGSFYLNGTLDLKILEKAIAHVIIKHDTLRTRFIVHEGKVRQKIEEFIDKRDYLRVIDLSNDPGSEKKCHALVAEDEGWSFDFSKAPLFKCSIIRVTENKAIFSFNFHHIITDGWSGEVFFNETSTFYNSLNSQNSIVFEPLKIQYKDYTTWQQKIYHSQESSIHSNYWIQKLKDVDTPYLPGSNVFTNDNNSAGKRVSFKVEKELTQKLKNFSRRNNVTLFMTLMAVLHAFISRYNQRKTVVIGTPVAGRNHQDLHKLIGFFANTLPIKSFLQPDITFELLLQQIKTTIIEAFSHQDYPFDDIVSDLKLNWEKHEPPLFNVMMVLHNTKQERELIPGVEVEHFNNEIHYSQYDWVFHFNEGSEELQVDFDFNINKFNPEIIRLITSLLLVFTEKLIESPTSIVEEVPLISAKSRDLLLHKINDTTFPFPNSQSVIKTFETQVATNPNFIAIAGENESITFKALNSKANQIAKYLKKEANVKKGDLIGVLLKTTEFSIPLILGILKVGCAYVPMEENAPYEKLNTIIEDTAMKVLFVDSSYKHKIPKGITSLLFVEKIKAELDLYSKEDVNEIINPADPVYVIYTSGSTGKPKGVMISHKNLNRLAINESFPGFKQGAKVLQAGTFSFDSSIMEIWITLLNGATLVMADKHSLLNIKFLDTTLKKQKISLLFLTSSWFNSVVDESIATFDTLNYCMIGGEKVSNIHVKKFKQHYPHIELINAYGPTENCVVATTYTISGKEEGDIPIGQPISNSSVYVFDQNDAISPKMFQGEIVMGGEGVGIGYLNNPKLTGEKFIQNPYNKKEVLYRSGDIGYIGLDNQLYYVERLDNQVKVRGFRIELNEIKSHILQYEGMEDVIVTTKKDKNNVNEIIAYLKTSEKISLVHLNNFLSHKLANYMIPSFYGIVTDFPLAVNGKLDYKQLESVTLKNVNTSPRFVDAGNAVERKLVRLFSEILELERVGIKDDFFDLGGHSLKATKLMASIYNSFEVTISLADIFENRTVESLSRKISELKPADVVPVVASEEQDYYQISKALKNIIYAEKYGSSANITTAITLKNVIPELIIKAIKQVIERHDILRTAFRMVENELVKVVYSYKDLALISPDYGIELLRANGKNIDEIITNQNQIKFNVEMPFLLKVCLVDSGENNMIMALTIHHAIADGRSIHLMQAEMLQNYDKLTNDKDAQPEPLEIQYKDFLRWEKLISETKQMHDAKCYWLDKFRKKPNALLLPLDFHRPQYKTFEGRFEEIKLSELVSRRMEKICSEEKVSIYLLFVAILHVHLHKLTGEMDIVIGSPVVSRPDKRFENQLGYYINILPLRTEINLHSNFLELLNNVRKNFLNAHQHQIYTIDQLISDLHLSFEKNRFPLFDVVAVMQEPVIEADGNPKSISMYEYNMTGETSTVVDLRFVFQKVDGYFTVGIDYNTHLFHKNTIALFLDQFKLLVSRIIDNRASRITDLVAKNGFNNQLSDDLEHSISNDFDFKF